MQIKKSGQTRNKPATTFLPLVVLGLLSALSPRAHAGLNAGAEYDALLALTGSPVAQGILDDWDEKLKYFLKVMPNDYRRVLTQQAAEREKRIAEESKTQPAGNVNAELAEGLVRHGAEKAG